MKCFNTLVSTFVAIVFMGGFIPLPAFAETPLGDVDLTGAKVEVQGGPFVYDGTAKVPAVTVTLGEEDVPDTGYGLAYENNTDAGEAVVTVTGKEGYTGACAGKFTIEPAKITSATLEQTRFTYDGYPKQPAVVVKAGDITVPLAPAEKEGSEKPASGYTVAYIDNSKVGTARAVITGKGNFGGAITREFEIVKASDGGSGSGGGAEASAEPLASVRRLAGADRYKTMAKIVAAGFGKSDYAVIATGENFPDALAASALAGAYDCPVILTKKDELSKEAADTLRKLGVKSAFVMGGEAAVSEKAFNAVKSLGIEAERVAGSTRQDTSVAALNKTKKANKGLVDTVIIATGEKFADTLSIGPWSYANSVPIVLTKADGTLTDDEVKAIKEAKPKQVIAVGGTAVVSDKVKTQLGMDVKRLYGETRYETSAAIAKWELENGMTLAAPAVATGENFPDALAGAALCGKNGSVMVLTSDKNQKALDKLKGAKGSYVLGGESAVSVAIEAKVKAAVE